MKHVFLLFAIAFSCISQGLYAQNVAVKTNLLSDAALSPNLGVEIGLAPRWSLDVNGQFNVWTLSNDKKWKHWLVQPEVRYWLCEVLGGHYFGFHAMAGQYNVGGFDGRINFLGTDARKLKDSRYQGWFVGAGVAYGYAWILGRHWNLEAEVGFGYS